MLWTDPLPYILHLQSCADFETSSGQRLTPQQVSSLMKPDFIQNLTGNLCLYQVVIKQSKNRFRVSRLVAYIVWWCHTFNCLKECKQQWPLQWVGSSLQYLYDWASTSTWRNILFFVPEIGSTYAVLIFDQYGIEKQFPWYNRFFLLSVTGNKPT